MWLFVILIVGIWIYGMVTAREGSQPVVEVCTDGHAWEWPEDGGGLACTKCKRTAYEIMNG